MARSPAQKSTELTLKAPNEAAMARKLGIAALLADGRDYREVAEKLAKGNKNKERKYRRAIKNWMTKDEAFQSAIATSAMAEARLGLPRAMIALVKRAERGRPDAIKLLFEVTGFYNPKVQHEHSGEIKIKLEGVPRPTAVEDVIEGEVIE